MDIDPGGHILGEKFEINKALENGRPTARFPEPSTGLGQFVTDPQSYLEAIKATAGAISKEVGGPIMEVLKSLGVAPSAYSFTNMSFMPDPANAGLLPWPGIAPESLRKIARENIAPQLVIRSRVTDVASFSGLSTRLWEPGWTIALRESSDTPTTQDKRDIKEAERFVWNCNRDVMDDARERDAHNIHPFDDFMRRFADDTFTFDGWSVWTDMDRTGRIKGFAPLPAGNIRLAIPGKGYNGDPRYFAALVDDVGNPVMPFTRDEMFWAVRNPRNDPQTFGYGWAETEVAIRMVQAFENGIELNAATFTKNSMPNGMLLMKGDFFNQSQIDALMREFTNMKRGISKSWGVPVMSVPDDAEVEILNFMDMKGQEIRYKDHLNLMGGIYCVISQFPPRRIGIFASGHTRDNAPLPNESLAIAGVDDPGIAPLLNFFAMRMNEYVIWPNWPKLMFKFNGASPKQDAREYEERAKARVWKESRNDVDLPPLERGAPKWIRPVLDLMDYAPQDPGLAGIYQTLAVKMLELQFGPDETEGGEGGGGGSEEEVGAPFPSKTDAAASETHGHASGVRRDSAKEESNAKPNTPAGAKIGPSSVA